MTCILEEIILSIEPAVSWTRRYQITRHFIQGGIYLLTQISEYSLLKSNTALSENKSEVLEIKTTGFVC